MPWRRHGPTLRIDVGGRPVPALGRRPCGRAEGGPGGLVRAARPSGADGPGGAARPRARRPASLRQAADRLAGGTASRPAGDPVEAPGPELTHPMPHTLPAISPPRSWSRISPGSTGRPSGSGPAQVSGDLRRLLGPTVAPALGAAAHAPIGLHLLGRSPWIDGSVLRGCLRELARNPEWRVDVDGLAGGDRPFVEALLEGPLLGPAGSDFIQPMVAHGAAAAAGLLADVSPDAGAAGRAVSRVAAWSMLQEPRRPRPLRVDARPHHSPGRAVDRTRPRDGRRRGRHRGHRLPGVDGLARPRPGSGGPPDRARRVRRPGRLGGPPPRRTRGEVRGGLPRCGRRRPRRRPAVRGGGDPVGRLVVDRGDDGFFRPGTRAPAHPAPVAT